MRLPTPLLASCLALATLACSSPTKARGPTDPVTGAPLAADPRLIEMHAEATATLVPADSPSSLAVRIRVSAGRLPGGARPPLNLTLVLDTSGSMEGDAIIAARDAARALVGRMDLGDRVSVVVFHSTAEVLVPSTQLTEQTRADIDARLAAVEARGTTAMAEGLALGLAQAVAGHGTDTIDRVVLLGDGVANDPSTIPALIAQARSQRLAITTLGLGIEFDEQMLGQIAMETGGIYRYLDEPEAVAQVFDEELIRMKQVVGRNLQLQLRPGPGVTIDDVPGFTANGAVRWAMLGDLAAGENRDVIVPLQITGRRDGASVELIDAVLTFDDAVAGSGAQQRTAYGGARASADAVAVEQSIRVEIAVARDRARAAGAILTAIAMARGNNVEGARLALVAAEAEARAAADLHDDADLRDLADQMAELKNRLTELVQVEIVDPVAGEAPTMSPAAEDTMRRAHEKATQVFDTRD